MKLGVIGGSGLYEIDGLKKIEKTYVATPFGDPSDEFISGILGGHDIVFLPRHGKGHTLLPAELNHRANIFALKLMGVTHILSISAVGSFREELRPRDVVVVDQYFDRTKRSADHTFFGEGIAAHIAFGDPVCPNLAGLAVKAAEQAIAESDDTARKVYPKGIYLNMEGPAFSTKAESMVYKSWGMDVIGMTNMAEAKLAREAEMCYATMAMVTDYDCWHQDHDNVTVELIIANLMANSALAKSAVRYLAATLDELPAECACNHALASAIITSPGAMPKSTRKKLAPIIGKYLK